MDLCGPMRVASINGKRYILVIVDDYSRYTWTHFLRSKDETPKVLIDFLRLVQRGLQAQVRVVRTDKGTEFLNQTLHVYFVAEGILHQTFVARTPEQNGDLKAQLQDKGIVIRVVPTTSVSRPQLKSNLMGDRVMCNNSQGKKQDVEDQRRNVKLSKNITSVTACNDSLNAKTLNVNFVCATCDKCVLNERNDMCVLKSINGVISRTKMPIDVPIVLFIVDSGCSKHMMGNLKLLINFVEKFLGTVKFGNDQMAPVLGYGDLVQGAVMIKWVYYVEGLNHNLFSVGQFRDADLEVAFRKSTCHIRDLKGNDLLTAWLWHRRLSHLNFDTINLLSTNDIVVGLPNLKFVKDHLFSSCELGKARRKSFHTKTTPSSKRRLQLLHMDLCGPMQVASINGKRYVLVIVDDYSRYTWTHFLRSKDETPEVLIDFLRLVQRGLQAQNPGLVALYCPPAICWMATFALVAIIVVRAGEQYLLRNFDFKTFQVKIKPVGLFLSQRLMAPVRDTGKAQNMI
nr:hypothetical protein [Tanacetum cinerariifolium]